MQDRFQTPGIAQTRILLLNRNTFNCHDNTLCLDSSRDQKSVSITNGHSQNATISLREFVRSWTDEPLRLEKTELTVSVHRLLPE